MGGLLHRQREIMRRIGELPRHTSPFTGADCGGRRTCIRCEAAVNAIYNEYESAEKDN